MGGGALSSKNVSKLVGKEVSKKLRNFSFAIKKVCHCEDERSEDVAIAKSLNINEITTQSSIARNDNNRHPELADCELRAEFDGKMAKPLQTSIVDPLNASNQAVSASQTDTVFSHFTSHFSRKRVAFTLAEVLITLGIIGVVAALTLPSVIQNYREQQTVAKLKKIYSILNQAMISAVNEYGTLDTWGLRDGDASEGAKLLQDRIFVPNLKIINYCEKLNSCVGGKPYKYITGTEHISYNGNGGYRRLILSDGTTLIYHVSSEDCNSDIPHAWTGCASINVDVDGYYKGPNTFGKDTFSFNVMKNRIVPYGTQTDTPDFQISCNRKNTYGLACTAWVIFNENLDYLHCDDLQWGIKIKCKQ